MGPYHPYCLENSGGYGPLKNVNCKTALCDSGLKPLSYTQQDKAIMASAKLTMYYGPVQLSP